MAGYICFQIPSSLFASAPSTLKLFLFSTASPILFPLQGQLVEASGLVYYPLTPDNIRPCPPYFSYIKST
ncbi:hypothetical protein L596_000318 [Steinernema carpocapsae]|uniref:Uncharacterized protein n=1 Tax=Steinernema carpocapsae TaxID=34508 RepID=A0A4U8UM03_STECR|nr:hypothetical protein L596_000318 [Steinernema carpocapsae]